MSDTAPHPSVQICAGDPAARPVRELVAAKTVRLGEHTDVHRLVPRLGRRMVGAWCFVHTYGPDDIADEPGMQVARTRTPGCRRSAGSSTARCTTATRWVAIRLCVRASPELPAAGRLRPRGRVERRRS
ncbi:MAG: hypothetical protein L0I76_09585 [Pseudonocardia sp.]|nr:hypothetical protein [Pseudonocardia sp.]